MLKNLLTLGWGELVARGMHAVAILLLARAVGPEAFGDFGLAAAVTSYATVFVLQGFDAIAMRHVARAPADLARFTRQVIGTRLVLAAIAGAAIAGYALLGHPAGAVRVPLLVLTLSYATNAITPRWSFLAIEESRPIAVAGFLSQLVFLTTAALVRTPEQVVWAAVAQVLGEGVAAWFLLHRLSARTGPIGVTVDRAFAGWLMREAAPVTISLLLGNMLYNFDVLMLDVMGRRSEIGIYVACIRCCTFFVPLVGAFQLSAFPWIARSYPDYAAIRARIARLTVLGVVVLAAAAAILGVFAKPLLTVLFGDAYTSGVPLLRIAAWLLPLVAARALLRQVLVAYHAQHLDTRNLALAVSVNVVLDIALIPHFGAIGCAMSTVAAETVFFVASALTVRLHIASRRGAV